MLGWLRQHPGKARRLADRILEAMREIGVLLLAFTPLDIALNPSSVRDSAGALLLFIGVGLFLFGAALVFEWRRNDDG